MAGAQNFFILSTRLTRLFHNSFFSAFSQSNIEKRKRIVDKRSKKRNLVTKIKNTVAFSVKM